MKTLLMLVLAAATASAANFAGKWTISGDVVGNPVKGVCTFEQNETKITGSCKLEGRGETKVIGEAGENKVKFSFDVEHEGATYSLAHTGELTPEGGLKGTIEVPGAGVGGDFTAKRGE